MPQGVPARPFIYHIVHVDRLRSIIDSGGLLCDAELARRPMPGTTIGISKIKRRRMQNLLRSHPDLHVGDCVPFFFCFRSPMLYMIAKDEEADLTYHGGEDPILHLVADMHETIQWAEQKGRRWAFTTGNAGRTTFDDYASLNELHRIGWDAIMSPSWRPQDRSATAAARQSEFLLERHFPWERVRWIGCNTAAVREQVNAILSAAEHKPPAILAANWYHRLEDRNG